MAQEDFFIREIQRFAQFLALLLSRLTRAKGFTGSAEQIEAIFEMAQQDKRVKRFLDPETDGEELRNLAASPDFSSSNREDMAELLIALAAHKPALRNQYFERAKFLLEQPSDTISLRQMNLLDQIPD